MNTRLFGTDGIRARAGEFPLNSATVVAIGRAIGERLGGRLLIGQDTRVSSPWILARLHEGIRQTPAQIEDAGVIPTPAIALLTKHHPYAGGVMISASHNVFDDNGIKVFAADGRKLNDADERKIEQRIAEILGDARAARSSDEIPEQKISAANSTKWPDEYAQLLLSHFPSGSWLNGMRIVVDCANGAMTAIAPSILAKLGASLKVIHAEPSGKNINQGCGAVHWQALVAAMSEERADFGVAFDGDGDRSMFVDAAGHLMDGDAVLLMMSRRLKAEGRLDPPIVVGTQMTNFSLEQMLGKEGIELRRVAVGDRFIFEEMLRSGAVIGGEPSGHIIFSDFRLSGDGLLTALKVAETMARAHASFDHLTSGWSPSPQLLKGVRMTEKIPLEKMQELQTRMAAVEAELQGRGRLLVRYSGTEPLLRVMIESDDTDLNERFMGELIGAIHKDLSLAS